MDKQVTAYDFTRGELKLIFERIEEKLAEIKNGMEKQHTRYDAEISALREDFKTLEKIVEDQDKSITRIMAIGGTLITLSNMFAIFLLNKIF